ncbi:MAG: FAD-dependent oxidoreductase [Solirubrobacterales bacterium]|nr:FAD-dependent oxidoreductase [Solirubrobacterales bacterium]MCB8971324.1 FAD-dependent oxidoreductase [Thermoleophilales bacterium]MCO5325818.1 FAD-binding oxidoreductase [Solirubrobacterales bacterium]
MRHDAQGYWIAEAGLSGRAPLESLTGDRGADVVVVGGGYTGMWAAWRIKEREPGAEVVVLEADRCGFGPSGRNGGFVNSMWFSLPTMRAIFGDEKALTVARLAGESVGQVGAWCEEQEVDAWFTPGGYLQASTAPHFDSTWSAIVSSCEELGAEGRVEELDREATAARCASPLFRCAAYYPQGATVQPARLADGLRRRLLDAGVVIHERSAVRSVTEKGGEVVIAADMGTVRAKSCVLAAGSSLLRFRPLRRALTATSSHMVITEPVPDLIDELGWRGGECITDSRAMVHYFRTTQDDRIAFGWGGGRIVRGARLGGRAEIDREMTSQVAEHLRRFFPQLAGRRIDHAWGGPIDVSPTHVPVVRTTGERTYAGFGYTGNGVGPSQMVGRALASLALGVQDEHSRMAIVDPPRVRVPPEPFRFAGGTVIRRAILRKELAEEEDRVPGPITRMVSGIPERMGIHVGR